MTASATPPSATAAAAAMAAARRISAPSPTFSTISSASSWAAPSRAAGAATSARLGPALRSRDQARGRLRRPPGRAPGRYHRAVRALRAARAPRPAPRRRTCAMCGGRGQVRARQGFFVVEQTCPTCRGVGETIADPCPSCRGEGRVEKRKSLSVNIPAGVDEGTRIRLAGEGEAGRARRPGRAISTSSSTSPATRSSSARARPCSRAARSASPPPRWAATIEVPGLDRQKHEIRIPAGIQSGKQLRQRGAGMPAMNGRGHGDMVIQIEVETPTRLTRQAARDPRSSSATPRPARNARPRRASSRS